MEYIYAVILLAKARQEITAVNLCRVLDAAQASYTADAVSTIVAMYSSGKLEELLAQCEAQQPVIVAKQPMISSPMPMPVKTMGIGDLFNEPTKDQPLGLEDLFK